MHREASSTPGTNPHLAKTGRSAIVRAPALQKHTQNLIEGGKIFFFRI